jgi:hypothetical protein
MEKMTITETIGQITNNNLGSIYSKDDVIRLLENIKQEEVLQGNIEDILNKLKDKLESIVNNLDSSDVCDYDSAEFSIRGREIEVDSIDVNHSEIWDQIGSEIDEFINEIDN